MLAIANCLQGLRYTVGTFQHTVLSDCSTVYVHSSLGHRSTFAMREQVE
jgi:hypothetical protein